MNSRIDSLKIISLFLGQDRSTETLERLRHEIEVGGLNWGSILTVANLQIVTPALWVSLNNKGLADALPQDLREYLAAIHSLNAERNRHLKQQAIEVVRELNEWGIEPVLLKGAAHLFTDTFNDIGARMMGDLDILVPEESFDSALASLQKLGYRSDESLRKEFFGRHHDAPLARPDTLAAIELHRQIMAPAGASILPTETALAQSRLLAIRGARLRVLSPTHRVFHNILHSEVVDRNHRKGVICLRQLHDLVSTASRYAPEIDWRAIREVMKRHGRYREFQAYLFLARHLFGFEISPPMQRSFAGISHYVRCHFGIRWAWFGRADYLRQRFSAERICRDYGCECTPLPVMVARGRYALYLLKKYAGGAVRSSGPS